MLSPTRVVVHQQRHAVAAGAHPDDGAVGHLRAPVVGAPEQKNGARSTLSGIRSVRSGGGGARRSPALGRADSAGQGRSRRRRAARPTASVGCRRRRACRRPSGAGPTWYSASRTSVRASGSSPRRRRSRRRPRRRLDDWSPSNGSGSRSCSSRMPTSATRVERREAEPAQRLAHLAIGVARGDDAEPGVGRIGGQPVEAVVDAVAAGQVEPHLVELLLDGDHPGPEELGRWMRCPDLPSISTVGITGSVVEHRKRHGAGAVGDRRDDLERRPQPGRARHGDPVQAEFETLGDGGRDRGSACAGRPAPHPTRTASSTTWRPGRRRRAPAPAPCAGRRRTRRGARIGGAVEAGCLAVPDPDHAVVACVGSRGASWSPSPRWRRAPR